MSRMQSMDALIDVIRKAHSIALICHVNPDGDALGSLLAMRLGLLAMGKECTALCPNKVPDYLAFMPGAQAVRLPESLQPGESFDLLLALDVAAPERMGSGGPALLACCADTAQIDHHATNIGYMQHNYVVGEAPATGLLVQQLLERASVAITRDMAICLYTAISTDTGNLGFNSTSAEAFYAMGRLMEAGLPLNAINRLLYRQWEPASLRLLCRALQTLRFHHHGAITSMYLSLEDFAACQAGPEHADSIVNYGLDIIGVQMTVLARETPEAGKIKMSLRAVAPACVNDVAQRWGGGGHAQAAGVTMQGSLDECLTKCIAAMEKSLDGAKA